MINWEDKLADEIENDKFDWSFETVFKDVTVFYPGIEVGIYEFEFTLTLKNNEIFDVELESCYFGRYDAHDMPIEAYNIENFKDIPQDIRNHAEELVMEGRYEQAN